MSSAVMSIGLSKTLPQRCKSNCVRDLRVVSTLPTLPKPWQSGKVFPPVTTRAFYYWEGFNSLTIRQARIIPHHEVAVDFLDEVQGDAHDDEQAGAAVEL